MKIVYIVETFTEGLGYIDNLLPREFSKLGHEVQVLSAGLPPYYMNNESFFGDSNKDNKFETIISENYQLHYMPYSFVGKRVVMKGLFGKLKRIKPDVVVVRGISSFVLGQVVLCKLRLNFSLFTSTGQSYSSLPEALINSRKVSIVRFKNLLLREAPGRLFSFFIDSCIGSTQDCVDCVVDYYGVPRKKTHVISLGVDTGLFHPADEGEFCDERNNVRSKLRVASGTVLCIWTGRLTEGKAAWVLAEAVDELCNKGHDFHALFIGSGPEEVSILTYENSTLLPFMKWSELPAYYRAADIAVWPRLITTSTLDASASGLPVVMSNKEQAAERWDGIGLTYDECDVKSLVAVLSDLADNEYRYKLGRAGVLKMENEFSWNGIAKNFIIHFKNYFKN